MYEQIKKAIRLTKTDKGDWSDKRFNELAIQLFQFQFKRNEKFRKYVRANDVEPDHVESYRQIPAVPVDVFKHETLSTASSPNDIERIFRTSGTTTGVRGEHYFERLDCYEESVVAGFERFCGVDQSDSVTFLSLIPSSRALPDSSLSYMNDIVFERFGSDLSRICLDSKNGLQIERFRSGLKDAIQQNQSVFILTTAYAMANFMERRKRNWSLPNGSKIMETGGFKGKNNELDKETYYKQIQETFELHRNQILSEYSMTELSSQAYLNLGEDGGFKTPPWAKIDIVDPQTFRRVEDNSKGLIRWYDLANVGSVMALITSDIGRGLDKGIELCGRAEGAQLRGCSLAAEEMIEANQQN